MTTDEKGGNEQSQVADPNQGDPVSTSLQRLSPKAGTSAASGEVGPVQNEHDEHISVLPAATKDHGRLASFWRRCISVSQHGAAGLGYVQAVHD